MLLSIYRLMESPLAAFFQERKWGNSTGTDKIYIYLKRMIRLSGNFENYVKGVKFSKVIEESSNYEEEFIVKCAEFCKQVRMNMQIQVVQVRILSHW